MILYIIEKIVLVLLYCDFCTYLCVLSLALSLSLWNDIIRYIQMNSGVMIGTRGSTIGTKSALKWKVKLKWKLRFEMELRLKRNISLIKSKHH